MSRLWRALGFVSRPDDEFLKKALGCWPRRDDMLIVFEHMPGGSLEAALHESDHDTSSPDWWLRWQAGGQGIK